jgi:hypothetical protein
MNIPSATAPRWYTTNPAGQVALAAYAATESATSPDSRLSRRLNPASNNFITRVQQSIV